MSKNKLIQLIHIAKGQLAIDDETYRQMLHSLSGKYSTRQCTIEQLEDILRALKLRGFSVRTPMKAQSRKPDSAPQSKKIRALWLTLCERGAVHDSSEQAIAAWIKRETGRDTLQWLDNTEASQCIEKLKKWLARVAKEKRDV